MKLHGVEMIPSGLVTCFINQIEVRITELATQGFSFRTDQGKNQIKSIRLCFFRFKESRYQEVELKMFHVIEMKEEEFYSVVTIGTQQEEYRQEAIRIIKDYGEYIQLKLTGDDAYCSQEKVGYPAQLEEEFCETYSVQEKGWFEALDQVTFSMELLARFDLALSIDNHKSYKEYLQEDMKSFAAKYWKKNGLENHAFAGKAVKRIYIGNQFCHNLFPDDDTLLLMIKKSYAEGLEITLAFTYLRECLIEKNAKIIDKVYEWCKENHTEIEVIVNDWGMVRLLAGKDDYLRSTLGILLNKRRKDPRYSYKAGYNRYGSLLAENSLNGQGYREFLEEKMKMDRYEYESCGYRIKIPTSHHSLQVPFYQTNTSQYCTLYAMCTTMDRGKQVLVTNCPRYCEEFIFSYPKHLKMVGRYNSIFGMDDTILRDPSELAYYLNHGIDRIVMNL